MKKLLAILLAVLTLLSLAACGNTQSDELSEDNPREELSEDSPKEIDTAYFSSLNKDEDRMEMRTAYYPNVPKGKVSKLDYTTLTSNGFMPTYNYVWGFGGESTEGSKQRVHILPVIFHDENEDPSYYFSITICFIEISGDYVTYSSFENIVILTDEHRYEITGVNHDSSRVSSFIIGKAGYDMLKDICSCGTVTVRFIDEFGAKIDMDINGSDFQLVLDTCELFEKAGGFTYDFKKYDNKITVS